MKALLALIICTVFFAGSSANATVYEINLSVGAGSVTGVIETNGANGELSASDIVDWNLLINNGAKSFNLLGPLSGNNSQGLVSGPGFTATPTGLFLDFSQRPFALFQSPFAGSGTNGFGVNCSGDLMIVVGARAVSVADPQGIFRLGSVGNAELNTELRIPVNIQNDGRAPDAQITPEALVTDHASSSGNPELPSGRPAGQAAVSPYSSFGSLAKLIAIGRSSSRLSKLAAYRLLGSSSR